MIGHVLRCLLIPARRCEEQRRGAACPVRSVLLRLLYQNRKGSSRLNSHIYIPIFYKETHIARLIKDSSSRGKQGRKETGQEVLTALQKKKKKKG